MNKHYDVIPTGLRNSSTEYNKNYDYNPYENIDYSLSNVCYMNSSIQCLFHLREFADFIINDKHYSNKPLLTATRNLLIDMISYSNKNKKALSVEEIKNEMSIIDDRYKYNNQEDANEFIANFLDALREETSDKYNINIGKNLVTFNDELMEKAYEKFYNKFYVKKGNSSLLDLLYGTYITETRCKKCKSLLTVKFSAFNMIELPIYHLAKLNEYNKLNINKILDSYFSESKIYDKTCECGEKEVYSKISIFELPQNLIVFFGRTANGQYINDRIDYSNTLNLNEYLHEKSNKNYLSYHLSGKIHYFSFKKKIGHYTASCIYKGEWFYFDDKMVLKQENNQNEIILFYES